MRGLLRNEYYAMKRIILLYAAVLAIYYILGLYVAVVHHGAVPLSIQLYADIFSVVLVVYSFSYEEKSGWNRFVNTFPVSRKKIVRGKYLFGLAVLFAAAAAGMVLLIMFNIRIGAPVTSLLWVSVMFLSWAVDILAVVLPILFLLGAEKGRLAVALVFVVLIFTNDTLQNIGFIIDLTRVAVWKILALSCGPAAILLLLSCLISTIIYNRKEF